MSYWVEKVSVDENFNVSYNLRYQKGLKPTFLPFVSSLGYPSKMTSPISFDPSIASPEDAFDVLNNESPEVRARLDADGYEFAGADVVGRCQGNMTLFLELIPKDGVVKAWVFEVTTQQFVGESYVVSGTLGAATEKARHLVESVFSEDALSGTSVRRQVQQWEQVQAG